MLIFGLEKQRSKFLLDKKIPNKYVILERKYNNGDIKFYIQIETETYSREHGYHKCLDKKFFEKEFDDIESAKNVVKELIEQEKPLIVIDDKFHSVIFDKDYNVVLNGMLVEIK